MNPVLQSVLAMIVQSLPMVEALVDILDREKTSDIPEIMDLAKEIMPNVQALVAMVENIKGATQEDYAEVWDPIKDRWNNAFEKWQAGNA